MDIPVCTPCRQHGNIGVQTVCLLFDLSTPIYEKSGNNIFRSHSHFQLSAEMGHDVKNSNPTLSWTHFETKASYADPKAQGPVASLAFSRSQTNKIRKSLYLYCHL